LNLIIIYTMNWWGKRLCGKFIRLGLITTLLALILFSCEEFGSIGEELVPGTDTVGVYAVDVAVSTGTVKRDSIIAFGDQLLFGKYVDPVFGDVYAESYVSVIPTQMRGIPQAADAVLDSITLKIKVNYMYGPGVYFPQDLKIYQLADSLSYFRIVQNDGVNDTILNVPYTDVRQEYHRLLADTSIYQFAIDPYKEDSIYFRIKLDPAFGQEILNRSIADPETFTAFDRINAFMKGLAIVPGNQSNAIYGIDVATATGGISNSLMTIHYHTAADTLEYTFGMNQFRYNYIQGNRGGTELAGLNRDEIFTPPSGRMYGQAGMGITPFVDVSSILELKESVGKFIINNAMLYIEVEPHHQEITPPARLNVYAADSLGHPAKFSRGDTLFYYYTLDVSGSGGGQVNLVTQLGAQPAFINYIVDRRRYMIDLTLFLQGIVNGSNPYKRIVFYPHMHLNQFNDKISRPLVDRFVVDPSKIRLRVYYTTLR
jgi:hypothetical protein